MANTATSSLSTQKPFPGRSASEDSFLGGPWVLHLFPWDCWVGVPPVWAVGQPHACNLCVHSVAMVTQQRLVHGGWTGALKHAGGSSHRKLCCTRGFYGQSQYGAQKGVSTLLLWTNGCVMDIQGDAGFSVTRGSPDRHLQAAIWTLGLQPGFIQTRNPAVMRRGPQTDRLRAGKNDCLVALALSCSGRHRLDIYMQW